MTAAVAGAKDLGSLRKLEALTGGMLRPERKWRMVDLGTRRRLFVIASRITASLKGAPLMGPGWSGWGTGV